MTVNDWLSQAGKQLKSAGIGTARLDALVLMADCLDKNQAQVLADPGLDLTVEQQNWLARRLLCRTDHEPLAYIRGFSEFYGREFTINPDVLEPRPESETMIDLLKTLKSTTIIDVGTGSGALAITAKLELPKTEITAIDIDPRCLKIAKQNAAKHKVLIRLLEMNLLEGLEPPKNSTILANLPYVPDDYHINQAAAMEPRLAIFGGPGGLDLYRRLFKQIDGQKNRPKNILTESLPFQHQELAQIAQKHNYELIKTKDFIQLYKFTDA